LNVPRGAPYSKRHYYDLVKIYHPDRPFTKDHPLFGQLTAETRVQRYRIVVDAHDILSDPNKRAAYDLNGTGWNHAIQDIADWNMHGSGIYANATWEDWERWNNRHNGPQQHVVDQRTFTRLVILLVLFGGAVQASWIGQMNTGFEDKIRQYNEESARFLHGRKDNTVKQMDSNDARVQGFLIRRDPTGSGLKDSEHNVYRKELNPLRRPKESSQPDSQITSDLPQPADSVKPDVAET
jgi:curved DNA-binding protein CbpA